MSFEWPHFLSLAEKLIYVSKDTSLKEAYFRTSVSRAYYSAYGIAAGILNECGGKYAVPPQDAHKHVRDTFSYGDTRIQKSIGEDLRRLWYQRRKADYSSSKEYTCTKEQSETAVGRAKMLLRLLENPDAKKFR